MGGRGYDRLVDGLQSDHILLMLKTQLDNMSRFALLYLDQSFGTSVRKGWSDKLYKYCDVCFNRNTNVSNLLCEFKGVISWDRSTLQQLHVKKSDDYTAHAKR